jgi:hypothetical protein
MADPDVLELLGFVFERATQLEIIAMQAARQCLDDCTCLSSFESILQTAARQKHRLAAQMFEVLRTQPAPAAAPASAAMG